MISDISMLRTLPNGAEGPTFVMCSPEKLSAMGVVDSKEAVRVREGWESLKRTIEQLGGKVTAFNGSDANDTGYGEVWTRDAVIVLENEKAFLFPKGTRDIFHTRKMDNEAKRMAAHLEAQGLRRITIDGAFDGGDAIVDAGRKIVFLGHSEGNDFFVNKAVKSIQQNTDYRVIPIPRKNIKALDQDIYYHLDVGMLQLPKGEYLIDPAMVDEKTYTMLKTVLGSSLISFPQDMLQDHEIAKRSICSTIAVGDTLVMPDCPDILRNTLKEKGYEVVTPTDVGLDSGAWMFLNGGVRCATSRITDDSLAMKQADRSRGSERS